LDKRSATRRLQSSTALTQPIRPGAARRREGVLLGDRNLIPSDISAKIFFAKNRVFFPRWEFPAISSEDALAECLGRGSWLRIQRSKLESCARHYVGELTRPAGHVNIDFSPASSHTNRPQRTRTNARKQFVTRSLQKDATLHAGDPE